MLTFKEQVFKSLWKDLDHMAIGIFMQLMTSGMYLYKIPEKVFCLEQSGMTITKIINFNYLVTMKTLGLILPWFLEYNSYLSNLIYLL